MAQNNKIMNLMSIDIEERNVMWLKESIQEAIKIEFSTIPPYLCAMWSIKRQQDPVALSIAEIVIEEMFHMAIMCNLLTALDGTPVINTKDTVPYYPGPLPGGIYPSLTVPLQGLSYEALELFMEIEYPQKSPLNSIEESEDDYPTIGSFYSSILKTFERISPTLSTDRQVEGIPGLTKLKTFKDVEEAISIIVRQGEGSGYSPVDTSIDDLAHYYRFAEAFHGRQMIKNPQSGSWEFTGSSILFPEVWPMMQVPRGGYQKVNVQDPEVWKLIQQFDYNYTLMLNHLQACWAEGSLTELYMAKKAMSKMREPAVLLMQKEVVGAGGNYGPCFRLMNNDNSK